MSSNDEEFENVLQLSHEEEYARNCTGNVLSDDNAKKLIRGVCFHSIKECGVCYDKEKIWNLQCCNNQICKECLTNTVTKTSTNCPFCRANLENTINKYKSNKVKLNASKKNNENNINNINNIENSNKIYVEYKRNTSQNILYLVIKKGKHYKKPLAFTLSNIDDKHIKFLKTLSIIYKMFYKSIIDEEKLWIELCKECKTFKKNNKNLAHISYTQFGNFIIGNLCLKIQNNLFCDSNPYKKGNMIKLKKNMHILM